MHPCFQGQPSLCIHWRFALPTPSLLPLCFTAVPEPVVEAEEEPEEPESSARKSTLADLYDLVAGARALVVDVTPGMCAASLTQPALVCVMDSV